MTEETDFDAAFNELTTEDNGEENKVELDDLSVSDDETEVIDSDGFGENGRPATLEAVAAERDRLQHRINSDNGRVGAFQKKINALEAQLASNAAESSDDKPSSDDVADALTGNWGEFTEDYPDVAAAVQGFVDDRMSAAKEEFNSAINPLIEKQHEDSVNDGGLKMDDLSPGWRDKVQSSDFSDWLGTQPDAVQGLASSDDVSDASSLVSYYDAHMTAIGRSQSTPDDSGGNTSVDTLAEKRQRQLQGGETLPSGGAGINPDSGPASSDFDSAFSAFAKQAERQNQQYR